MKKAYLFIFLAFLFATGMDAQHRLKESKKIFQQTGSSERTSGTFIYTLTTLDVPYADLTSGTSVNNGEIWDDPEYIIPIGFPFVLNGNDVSDLQIFGVGALLISPTNDPDIGTAIFPFETDLVDRGAIGGVSLSPISYIVEGVPGSRIQKIEWKNVGSFAEIDAFGTADMFINFQIWLFEGSNRIEFHFGPSSITDPDIFYDGMLGAFVGLTDIDFVNDLLIGPHFLDGPANGPSLSASEANITGTPANGTVYRLSLELPLTLTVIGEDGTSACAPNGTATALPEGGAEPYSYAWSNNETSQTITNLDAGTYSVTVTDDEGSVATGSVTISNVEPLLANATSTDETSIDAEDGTASSTPSGGLPPYSFEWSNGETTSQITDLAPGVYTVTVTDASDCTDVGLVNVEEAFCPEIIIEVGLNSPSCNGLCDGLLNILFISGGTAPYNYLWSNGVTSESFQACEGDYFLTITDQAGCTAVFDFYVPEPDPLTVNVTSTAETSEDANDGTASASASGGTSPYTFEWSTGGTNDTITDLEPGFYNVTVTDQNGCFTEATIEVDSFGCSLTAEIIHNTCFESCDGRIEVTLINSVGPVSYEWSNGSTVPLLENLCAGTYVVTATDAEGCSDVGTYIVTEPELLQANTGHTDETTHSGNDGTAWATPTGGTPPYSYEWSNGSIDSLITDLVPDAYFVTVTDANGCVDVQSVLVNPFVCLPVIGTTVSNVTCFGFCDGVLQIEILSGVGPFTYNWETGDTTSEILNLCADTYTVFISDEGQGCNTNFSFDILQPDSLVITVDGVVHVTDSTSSAISISVTGGTEGYLYEWEGPGGVVSEEEDITGIDPGLYNIMVTDSNGCVAFVDSIEIRDETVSTSNPEKLLVSVFPNPAHNEVFIDVTDVTSYHIQIISSEGRQMQTWSNERRLDLGDFAAGMYMLKFTSGEKSFVYRLAIVR